jgi:hypothetical protein
MTQIKDLIQHLQSLSYDGSEELIGDWVKARSGYEKECAKAMGAKYTGGDSEHDCTFSKDESDPFKLELKKSKGGGNWLDLIRYSRKILEIENTNLDESQVVTLFFRYEFDRITDVYVVEFDKPIKKLNLTKEDAEYFVNFHKRVKEAKGRNVQHNFQRQLTLGDVKEIIVLNGHIKFGRRCNTDRQCNRKRCQCHESQPAHNNPSFNPTPR